MPHLPTTDGNRPFCHLNTAGAESNLQLYFMKKAYRAWEDLNYQTTDKRRELEELVFIVVCVGTSVCQLLGQNASHPKPDRIDSPKKLFDRVFGDTHRERTKFFEFIGVYDACRHFGPAKHSSVLKLDRDLCRSYLDLAIGLWDEIVWRYIGDEGDCDFKEYASIVSIIKHQG